MLDPIFTRHGAIRLMERGISRQEIMAAVNFGRIVERSDGKDVYALERLRVVVSDGNVVVTAWRVRKINAKRIIRKARQEKRKYNRRWK